MIRITIEGQGIRVTTLERCIAAMAAILGCKIERSSSAKSPLSYHLTKQHATE